MMTENDYSVRTKNRFGPLVRQNEEMTREEFMQTSLHEKLGCMFDDIRSMKHDQKELGYRFDNFENVFERCIIDTNRKIAQVTEITNAQTECLKSVVYRSIDGNARSRRNNLIFRGFAETRGENCFMIIRDFLANHLDIDSRKIYIARAHRIGKPDHIKNIQRRPIIVNFRDFCDTEQIMSKTYMLKETRFSVDHDFPKEIQNARARLYQKLKDLRREFPQSKVQIVYPAKLIKDGRLVQDELPEWNRYMNIDMLCTLNKIEECSEASTPKTNYNSKDCNLHSPPQYSNGASSCPIPMEFNKTSTGPLHQQPSAPLNIVPNVPPPTVSSVPLLMSSVHPIVSSVPPSINTQTMTHHTTPQSEHIPTFVHSPFAYASVINPTMNSEIIRQQLAAFPSVAQQMHPTIVPQANVDYNPPVSEHHMSHFVRPSIVTKEHIETACDNHGTQSHILVDNSIQNSDETLLLKPMNDSVATRNNVHNQNDSLLEETHVKSTETYTLQNHVNTAKSPVRGRSVSKTVRSTSRADKRTQSSKPYNRREQSVSASRVGKSKSKNRHSTPVLQSSDLENRQVNDDGVSTTEAQTDH
jgi:hypothetical protein